MRHNGCNNRPGGKGRRRKGGGRPVRGNGTYAAMLSVSLGEEIRKRRRR